MYTDSDDDCTQKANQSDVRLCKFTTFPPGSWSPGRCEVSREGQDRMCLMLGGGA